MRALSSHSARRRDPTPAPSTTHRSAAHTPIQSPRSRSCVSVAENLVQDSCPTPPPIRDWRSGLNGCPTTPTSPTAPVSPHDSTTHASSPANSSLKRNKLGLLSRVKISKKQQINYVDPASLPPDYFYDDDTRSLGPEPDLPASPLTLSSSPSNPPWRGSSRTAKTSTERFVAAPSALSQFPHFPSNEDTSTRPATATSVDSSTSFKSVQFSDAKKLLHLMNASRGRAKGELLYRTKISATSMSDWQCAYCYINAKDGSLKYEPRSSFTAPDAQHLFQVLAEGLHGCQVHIGSSFDGQPAVFVRLRQHLSSLDRSGHVLHPKKMSLRQENAMLRESGAFKASATILAPEIYHHLELRPVEESQIVPWLAALLCWEPVLPGRCSSEQVEVSRLLTVSPNRQHAELGADEEHAVIKYGNALMHDLAVLDDPLPQLELPKPVSVTCAIRANGEMTVRGEDAQTLMVLQVKELPRSAIRPLDAAITKAKHSIFIGLSYASNDTVSARIRPVILSFQTKAMFESWFSLFQVFACPEIHRPDFSRSQDDFEFSENLGSLDSRADWDYQLQRALSVKIDKLKLYDSSNAPDVAAPSRSSQEYSVVLLIDGRAAGRLSLRASTETGKVMTQGSLEIAHITNEASEFSVRVTKCDHHREQNDIERPVSANAIALSHEQNYGEALVCHNSLETLSGQQTVSILINRVGLQVGEVTFTWSFVHEPLLPRHAYEETLRILRSFDNGLTSKLYERTPSLVAGRYSSIMLNIFQTIGHVLPWFKNLIQKEIVHQAHPDRVTRGSATANESMHASNNTLFRDNSLLTRALDDYMKRVGSGYLEEILGPRLRAIQEGNVDCEVDPGKVDAEQAEHNWRHLIDTVTDLWTTISASASRCPRELRELFRHARDCAQDAFGTTSPQVYSSVTAFLFLRFIVPAIMSPYLWDLITEPANSVATRTFKQLSRAVNTLANMTEFGAKQQWMTPMNKFILPHRQSMIDYINEVCETEPAEPGSTSSKEDIAVRIAERLQPALPDSLPFPPGLPLLAPSLRALMTWWLAYVESASGLELACLDVSSDAFDPCLSKFTRVCRELRAKAIDIVRLTPRATVNRSVWATEWAALAAGIEEHPETVWRVPLSRPSSLPVRHSSGRGSNATATASAWRQGSRASVRSAESEGSSERGRMSVISRKETRESKKEAKAPSKDGKKKAAKNGDARKTNSPKRQDPYENMKRKIGFM